MAKQTGEMVEFKSKFTPEDRKVQDAWAYVREFVEAAVGIVKPENPDIIQLSDIKIDYVSGTRGGYSSPWNSTTVQGILLKTNDANYRYTVRKIMVKDGKINKTDLIKKYNELVEVAKTAKLEQEAKSNEAAIRAKNRKDLIVGAGYELLEYGYIKNSHGLTDLKFVSNHPEQDQVEMELRVSQEKAKQILALLKE